MEKLTEQPREADTTLLTTGVTNGCLALLFVLLSERSSVLQALKRVGLQLFSPQFGESVCERLTEKSELRSALSQITSNVWLEQLLRFFGFLLHRYAVLFRS